MPIQNVFGQFAPPVVSPAQVQNGLAQTAMAAQNVQNGLLDQQQKRDDMAQNNALQQAIREGGGDPEKTRAALQGRGLYKPLIEFDKAQAEIQQKQAAAAHSQQEALKSELANRQTKVSALATLWDQAKKPEDVPDIFKQAIHDKLLEPGVAFDLINKVPTDEAGFAAHKAKQVELGKTLADKLRIDHERLVEQGLNTRHAGTLAESVREHTTRDKIAQGQLSVAQGHLGVAQERLKQENAVGGAEGFSPAAIEAAASRYNVDGTLPPMGMGKAGSQGRQAILNRAAELAMGTSGTDQRIAQMDAKAAGAALSQLTKSKTMNAAFEKTANANANLALGLSEKLPRTGMPLVNGAIQAVRAGTGSPEATQFAAANETFVAEYAKIMSGGMGNGPVSDAARSKAEKLLTTAMTADQYKGNVKLLQTEMRNRMKGFEDEEGALRSRLGGKTETPAVSTPKVVKFGDLK